MVTMATDGSFMFNVVKTKINHPPNCSAFICITMFTVFDILVGIIAIIIAIVTVVTHRPGGVPKNRIIV